MDSTVDIQKLAEKLARAGSDAVEWEQKKLQWIIEKRQEQTSSSKTSAAA